MPMPLPARVLSAMLVLSAGLIAQRASPGRAVLVALMKADNASDLEAVLSLYAEDAALLPPNEPIMRGKAAIRERYTRMFASTRMTVRVEPEDDGVSGDLAFLRGRTVGTRVSTDGQRSEDLANKFVMIFERRGGVWLIHSLTWNPD